MKTISFNTTSHDDFIDFIKVYAIICVLFGHTFFWLDWVAYPIWAGMQVPLFIIIQAFHCYKKEQPRMDIIKACKRVLLPFMAVEVITIAIASIFCNVQRNVLINSVLNGGVWRWDILSMGIFASSTIPAIIIKMDKEN